MDSCAMPQSTVRQPSADARMGPMVEPHGMSLRTENSCTPYRPVRYDVREASKGECCVFKFGCEGEEVSRLDPAAVCAGPR